METDNTLLTDNFKFVLDQRTVPYENNKPKFIYEFVDPTNNETTECNLTKIANRITNEKMTFKGFADYLKETFDAPKYVAYEICNEILKNSLFDGNINLISKDDIEKVKNQEIEPKNTIENIDRIINYYSIFKRINVIFENIERYKNNKDNTRKDYINVCINESTNAFTNIYELDLKEIKSLCTDALSDVQKDNEIDLKALRGKAQRLLIEQIKDPFYKQEFENAINLTQNVNNDDSLFEFYCTFNQPRPDSAASQSSEVNNKTESLPPINSNSFNQSRSNSAANKFSTVDDNEKSQITKLPQINQPRLSETKSRQGIDKKDSEIPALPQIDRSRPGSAYK